MSEAGTPSAMNNSACARTTIRRSAFSGRIGERLGFAITQTPEERHAITRRLGAFKTSMLQDVEAGRELEIDALLGSVVELARLTETPTPHLDTVYALTKLLAKTLVEHRPLVGAAK